MSHRARLAPSGVLAPVHFHQGTLVTPLGHCNCQPARGRAASSACAIVDPVTRRTGRPGLSDEHAERVRSVLRHVRNERFDGNSSALGKALGMTQSAISQILSGKNGPSYSTVEALAELLGTDAAAVLSGAAAGLATESTDGRRPRRERPARSARAVPRPLPGHEQGRRGRGLAPGPAAARAAHRRAPLIALGDDRGRSPPQVGASTAPAMARSVAMTSHRRGAFATPQKLAVLRRVGHEGFAKHPSPTRQRTHDGYSRSPACLAAARRRTAARRLRACPREGSPPPRPLYAIREALSVSMNARSVGGTWR